MDHTRRLTQARQKVREGALYYHYKNPRKYYRVEKLAINEADHRILVVYTECDDHPRSLTWTRPLDTWLELVGDQPRFSLVE